MRNPRCSGSDAPTVTRYRVSPRKNVPTVSSAPLPRERVRSIGAKPPPWAWLGGGRTLSRHRVAALGGRGFIKTVGCKGGDMGRHLLSAGLPGRGTGLPHDPLAERLHFASLIAESRCAASGLAARLEDEARTQTQSFWSTASGPHKVAAAPARSISRCGPPRLARLASRSGTSM